MKTCLLLIVSTLTLLLAVSESVVAAENGVVLDSRNVIWGAVGHNERPQLGGFYPYNRVSINDQMTLLTNAGMRAYRAGCEIFSCQALATYAQAHNMIFLRSIEWRPDASKNEIENYKIGYDYALQEGKKYKGSISYYEASNELDNWVGMSYDGASKSQYNSDKYQKARGFIKGLVDGLHAADATIKVVVDDAGWCHYGFLKALWDDGVRWDITGIHFYASQGTLERVYCNSANIAAIHASFGKPIWITEFNSDSAAKSENPEEMAKWLVETMKNIRAIAPKYNIQAAFVYELFDEKNLKGMESNFGLADAKGIAKAPLLAIQNYLK